MPECPALSYLHAPFVLSLSIKRDPLLVTRNQPQLLPPPGGLQLLWIQKYSLKCIFPLLMLPGASPRQSAWEGGRMLSALWDVFLPTKTTIKKKGEGTKKANSLSWSWERNGLILTLWLPVQDGGPEMLEETTIPRRQCELGTLPASHQYSGAEERHIREKFLCSPSPSSR